MNSNRRRFPHCTARNQSGTLVGLPCRKPAWHAVAAPGWQGFVCGNHRRAFMPSALFYLTPVEATL